MTIDELCCLIAEETLEDELLNLELQKQYEFMQYAEDAADMDAEFYGIA